MLLPLRLVCVSVLMALFLAAWGPATSAIPVAPQAPEPAAPLRIGASISLTGIYDQGGNELRNGYLLWMEQVNATGGTLGRPVELVIYDDASDPDTAVNLYERLITQDKVDLIIGPYSSTITVPVSTVTEKYRFPMVAAVASATEIWTRGYRYVFGILTLARFDMDGAIDIAGRNGYRAVAIINENTPFPQDTAAGAAERAREAGLQIALHEEYGPDVRDLSPELTRIRALSPDVLIGGTFAEHARLIVRQLKGLNWAPKMVALTVAPGLPDFYDILGADSDYIFGTTYWEPSMKAPGVSEFVASYTQRYGYEPSYYASMGFGAAQLLQQAIERTQSFDNERIRDALATMETNTVFGPYKVDERGAQIAKPSYLLQWLKGERKIVWPDDVAEAAYTVPMPAWDQR